MEIEIIVCCILTLLLFIPFKIYHKKYNTIQVRKRLFLLMTLFILIDLLGIMILSLSSDYEMVLKIFTTIITIDILLLGMNYVSIKELINIDVELINRIWITLPLGMSFFVYIEDIVIDLETILLFINTISIFIGILLFFRIFRYLSNIQQMDSKNFWKFIHIGLFIEMCISTIIYFYSFESFNFLIGIRMLFIGFSIIYLLLIITLIITLNHNREVKKNV